MPIVPKRNLSPYEIKELNLRELKFMRRSIKQPIPSKAYVNKLIEIDYQTQLAHWLNNFC